MNGLPREIAEPLHRYVLRRRWIEAVRSIALAALFAMFWLLGWGVVDRFIGLPVAVRATLLVLLGALLLAIVIGPARAILRRNTNWESAARQMQQRDRRLGEVLATVVSRSLSPDNSGTSPLLLKQLQQQAQSDLQGKDIRTMAPVAPAGRAAATACFASLMFVALSMWPWLDLPRLVARQLRPFVSVSAATSTRITSVPGNMDVSQGGAVTISIRVTGATDAGVILRMHAADQPWTSSEMSPNPDGTWSRTLASIQRDITYEVRAGDAVSGPYRVRVLRSPIVRDLRLTFTYPGYVNRVPLTLTHVVDAIDAPNGTRVLIALVASEPLRSAWFIINGKRLPAQAAAAPNARQIEITLDHDVRVEIEMISERGARGTAQSELSIHSIPDHRPTARLLLPQGFSLLASHYAMQIPYQAGDDYGLSSLEARVELQDKPVTSMGLPLSKDARECQDEFKLDFAAWDFHVGQVVTITLAATDRAGQTTLSTPWRILIAPETVDPEQKRRVAELRAVAHLCDLLAKDLDLARRALDPASSAGLPRAASQMAMASESASQLSRSILRAGVGISGTEPPRAIAALIDAAQQEACLLDQPAVRSIADSTDEMRHRAQAVLDMTRSLQQAITTVWQGLDAQVILAQRRNLATLLLPNDPDLNRMREELDSQIEQSGLEPRMLDLDAQLQGRVDAMQKFSGEAGILDFVAATVQWAESPDPRSRWLWQRLAVAAQAEAVRGDADLAWARDLQLASQAVRSIDVRDGSANHPANDVRRELLSAIQVLLNRNVQPPQIIAKAREAVAIWAGVNPPSGEGLIQWPTTMPQPSAEGAANREAALDAIRQTQQFLAELPETLANVEQAALATQQAQNRLQDAIAELDAAAPEDQPAARSAVEAAKMLVEESFASLSDAADSLDPEQSAVMAREFSDLGPDTAVVATLVERRLNVALAGLRKAVADHDAGSAERQAADSRQAAANVQQALRQARQAILERDPAVAARWFARQAVTTAPATQPLGAAPITLDALASMWDDPIQRAIKARLAGQGSQSAVFKAFRISAAALPESGDHPWDASDPENATREPDPPAFKDAVDAYFHALGDAQQSPR